MVRYPQIPDWREFSKRPEHFGKDIMKPKHSLISIALIYLFTILISCNIVGNTYDTLPTYTWTVKAGKHHHTSYITNGTSDHLGVGKNHLRGYWDITPGVVQYHETNPEQISKLIGMKTGVRGDKNSVLIGHHTDNLGRVWIDLFVNYEDGFNHSTIKSQYIPGTRWYSDLVWVDETAGVDSVYYGFNSRTAYLIAGPADSPELWDTVSLSAPRVDIDATRLGIVEMYHGGLEPSKKVYTFSFEMSLAGTQHSVEL